MVKDIAIMRLSPLPPRQVAEGRVVRNRFLVNPTMGISPRPVEGIHNLAQYVSKYLLTKQGTDKFDPAYGTGFTRLLEKPITMAGMEEVRANVAILIRDLKKRIIQDQANLSLAASERLQELGLKRVEHNEDQNKLEIDLNLISEAGEERVLNLEPILLEEEEE